MYWKTRRAWCCVETQDWYHTVLQRQDWHHDAFMTWSCTHTDDLRDAVLQRQDIHHALWAQTTCMIVYHKEKTHIIIYPHTPHIIIYPHTPHIIMYPHTRLAWCCMTREDAHHTHTPMSSLVNTSRRLRLTSCLVFAIHPDACPLF